jgi:hypothetical protein
MDGRHLVHNCMARRHCSLQVPVGDGITLTHERGCGAVQLDGEFPGGCIGVASEGDNALPPSPAAFATFQPAMRARNQVVALEAGRHSDTFFFFLQCH